MNTNYGRCSFESVVRIMKELRRQKRRKDDTKIVYLMISPMLLGFVLFVLYPIFYVLRYALFEYDGIANPLFVGLDNFIRLFTNDPGFWVSVRNSLILTGGKIFLEVPFALILSNLLNRKSCINSIFRTTFFMPTIISSAIVGIVFSILFAGFNGIVNNLLLEVGWIHQAIDWFRYQSSAMLVMIISMIWSNFGVTMVFFIMGLQSIPGELYECAEIDGANKFKQFAHITVPMLAPILQIVLMLAIVDGMRLTDLPLVLTNGMPGGSTEVMMTYIFKYFFSTDSLVATASQYGYASAMSVVTAVIIGALTLVYVRISRNMKEF